MNELIIIAIVTVAFATIYFFIFIHTDVKISSKPIVMYVNLVNSVEETERITRDIICKMIERYENVELYVFFDANSSETKQIFEKIIAGKCKYSMIEV